MQNYEKCPMMMIPDNKEDINKMARNIGMNPDTLEETMKALNTEFSSVECPLNVTKPPISSVPVVPEREGRTLPLSSKSILGTRAASGMYGKRGRDMMGGVSSSDMMEILRSFGPSNAPGEDAARNLTRLVKMSILAIPTYLIIGGYFMNSVGYQTLSAGINAVFSGECTYLSSRIFSAFGIGNPICDSYNSVMATIYRAMNFNGVDMAIIGSSLTLLLATPALFNSFVDIITSVIAHSLKKAQTMNISDETLTVLGANASIAWTNWTTLAINSQVTNLIPSRLALVAGISQDDITRSQQAQTTTRVSENRGSPRNATGAVQDDYDDYDDGRLHTRFGNEEPQPPPRTKSRRRGGAKRKTRKSKRNSRKSKVGKRKTKRSNKKISRKTKHNRRKKTRKTKKYN
jgi:hypothetical protein